MRHAPLRAGLILSLAALAARGETPAERGMRFYGLGDAQSAIRAFEEAIQAEPSEPSNYINAALLYRDLELPEKSLPLFNAASRLLPSDPDIQAMRGWAALRSGYDTTAENSFARALTLAPDNASALLGAARLNLRRKRVPQALDYLEKLAASRPYFTLAHVLAARSYESVGDLKNAALAYKHAFQSDSTYTETKAWIMPLYAALQRADPAWLRQNKLLEADPYTPAALRQKDAAARRRDLAGRLSEKPEWVPNSRGVPPIRVAIGTSSDGVPLPRKAIAFHCNGVFEIRDLETGKRRIRPSTSKDVWLVRRAKTKDGYEIIDSRQRTVARFRKGVSLRPQNWRERSFLFKSLTLAGGTAWAYTGERRLKGTVELQAGARGLVLINILPVEDYLYGVINGEMPSHFPFEALKAQAVIARNHVLVSKDIYKPHRGSGYDVCDGQHCQVFAGMGAESQPGRRAILATRGLVLTWAGRLAQTPYSANCGGHTQDSGEVQGWYEMPYLKGSPDFPKTGGLSAPAGPWGMERWLKTAPPSYCNLPDYMHPAHFRWSRSIPAAALSERLNKRAPFGRLRSIRVLRRSRSGNINRIEFRGTKGHYILERENSIRAIFGVNSARSTMFLIEAEPGRDGLPEELHLYGGGWGHGVGLCQCGAAGRALSGQKMEELLAHYYPGTQLKSLGY